MSWFTDLTGDLGTGAQQIGGGVQGLLGGLLSPLTSNASNLLGTTQTTQTQTVRPDEAAKSSAKTTTMVIAALGVVTLIVIGIIVFKSSKTA